MSTPDYYGAVRPVESATDAHQILKQMPDKLIAQVDALARQGEEIVNNVRLNPVVRDALDTYTGTARRHAESFGEITATLARTHAADFDKIERADRRDAAWDIGRNRG